jgi:hypothetical protein
MAIITGIIYDDLDSCSTGLTFESEIKTVGGRLHLRDSWAELNPKAQANVERFPWANM